MKAGTQMILSWAALLCRSMYCGGITAEFIDQILRASSVIEMVTVLGMIKLVVLLHELIAIRRTVLESDAERWR